MYKKIIRTGFLNNLKISNDEERWRVRALTDVKYISWQNLTDVL